MASELLKGKRVLVVEDNPMNRAVFTIFFVNHEMNVIFDYIGQNTSQRLAGLHKVDLIILDLMLPAAVSGFDVYEEIRATPNYQDIPILIVSAADPMTAIPRAKSLGVNGFVAKPIDDELFPKQLEAILRGESVWYEGRR